MGESRDLRIGRVRSLLLATAALLLSVAVLLGFAASASAIPVGVQWTGDYQQAVSEMDQVGKSGAELFRVPLKAPESAGGSDWTFYDSLFEAAAYQGITILPYFEVNMAGNGLKLPSSGEKESWEEWSKKAVRRYGYNGIFWSENPEVPAHPVYAWEMWNEPNNAGKEISATQFGEFLSWAADAVQDASESWGGKKTKVLHGALLAWGAGTNYQSYLNNSCKNEWCARVTDIGFHPYLLDPATFPGESRLQAFKSSVQSVREFVDDVEAISGKAIWITETGWPVGEQYAVSEAEQAQLLEESITWSQENAGSHNLGAVIWYNARDINVSTWQYRCGLRSLDGSYRLAWFAFQRQTGAPVWPGPPTTTSAATSVGEREATLNGVVNPVGASTSYHFEFGTTNEYGRIAPVPDASAGSGLADVAASTTVSGLIPSTTYHYRLVATNSGGTSYGEDQTLTTSGYRYMRGASNGSGISDWSVAMSMQLGPSRVGDFNADGNADIVALEPEGGGKYRYQVGFSTGSGISSWKTVLGGMSLPAQLDVGDFNADGKADIVAAEAEGGSYSYRVGFSTGSGISSWSKVLSGMSAPSAMRVGDFNADGKADIVAAEAEGGSYSYRVGFSTGSGVSSWSKVLGGMSAPSAMRVGDFNADGNADIVALEPEGGGKYRYQVGFSTGSGISSWSKVLSEMSLPAQLDVGDFNADGKADIVALEPEGGSYSYRVGFSTGTGISSWSKVLGGMTFAETMNVGDFNADGKVDVVTAEAEPNGSYAYRVGISSGSSISAWQLLASWMRKAERLSLGDFNADGNADIVALEPEGGGKYRYQVGFSTGTGISSWKTVLGGMSLPAQLDVGDFNADGKADIVAAEAEGGSYSYRVGFSTGSGISSWSKVLSGMSAPSAMRVGDFNADGNADIVALEPEGGGKYRYQVGFSTGSGISSWKTVLGGMSLPAQLDVGDFNADGKADIVAAEAEGGSYSYRVGFSTGSGISSWSKVLSGMSAPSAMRVGDFNADGKADIVAAEPEGGSYSYRVGFSTGSGISSWSKVLGGMSAPSKMDVGDLDGDAKADIFVLEKT